LHADHQFSTISTSLAGNTAVNGFPAPASPELAGMPPMPTPIQSAPLQPLAKRHCPLTMKPSGTCAAF
jgi:hypothetical protein